MLSISVTAIAVAVAFQIPDAQISAAITDEIGTRFEMTDVYRSPQANNEVDIWCGTVSGFTERGRPISPVLFAVTHSSRGWNAIVPVEPSALDPVPVRIAQGNLFRAQAQVVLAMCQ